jgi:hypothetical protein
VSGPTGRLAPAKAGVGDEAVAIGGLATGVDDLDLERVDDQRIAPVAQRDIMEPTDI